MFDASREQGRAAAGAPPEREARSANDGLGARVRAIRRRQGLTLDGLAERSRVSRAMLSSVERGDKSPTLSVVTGIAAGLNVTISELMGEPAPFVAASVTPRGRRLVFRDGETGIERHLLSPTHLDNGMEVVEHLLPPGQAFEGLPHAGMRTTKCVVVSAGPLTLEIGNVVYTLETGDSVTFEVPGPYRFRNTSSSPCRYLLFILHQRLGQL